MLAGELTICGITQLVSLQAEYLGHVAPRDGRRAEAGQSTAGGGPGSLEAGDATRTLPTSRLPEPVSATAKRPAKAGKTAAPADDDLKDIEEILRKRGI